MKIEFFEIIFYTININVKGELLWVTSYKPNALINAPSYFTEQIMGYALKQYSN